MKSFLVHNLASEMIMANTGKQFVVGIDPGLNALRVPSI